MLGVESGNPTTETLIFDDPPEAKGRTVEFRLMYQGRLPAEKNKPRTQDKQRIRREIHLQLAQLWATHPVLVSIRKTRIMQPSGVPIVELTADNFQRNGFRFLPLVCTDFGIACSLDILFLRRESPGKIISGGGGDIDNRIKVLFDGLRMAQSGAELAGDQPGPEDDPFYCLLEDDSLITDVRITTDRLLTPKRDDESENDVVLIIDVKTVMVDFEKMFLGFA